MPRDPGRNRKARHHFRVEPLEARPLMALAGALDPSFGTDGIAHDNVPSGFYLAGTGPLLVQADGKIIETGSAYSTTGPPDTTASTSVIAIRLNPDGQLDPT